MNLPKIGDHIIVRKANGLMPTHLKNTIQVVAEVNDDAPIHDEGSSVMDSRGTVVRFPATGGSFYTSEWHIVPKIGDKVRATAGLADSNYYGQTCTVTQVAPNEVGVIVRGEFQSIQKPDDTILLGFSEWEPADEVKPSEETGIISDLQAQVRRLTEEVEAQKVAYNDMVRKRDGWRDDFHHQANSLLEEAENRGWCNEYEEFCDRVDGGLRFGEMPRREKEYTVTWQATVVVTVDMSRTYTATSEEAAIEMAQDDYCCTPEESEVVDAVRFGNWEEQDDAYREYEAEEV